VRKVVSEVLKKYDVCVCVCMYMYVCVVYDDVSDTTKPRHDSTNPETGISYANLGPQTEK